MRLTTLHSCERLLRKGPSIFLPFIALLLPGFAFSNPTQIENSKPGTTTWQLSNPAKDHEIEGYASLTSVNRGESIGLFVNTEDESYTIEIFRMGWYGGLGGRQVMDAVTRKGTVQEIPAPDAETGLIECKWTDPFEFVIPNNPADPTDWASGVYLAKLTGTTSGVQTYIIFVVRDDQRASDLLFQSSVTTFQAYNNWGGKSLYGYNSSCPPVTPPGCAGGCGGDCARARKVSFNRPYVSTGTGRGAGEFLTNISASNGPGWEYNMVRFLEREGRDVTYCTDVDTHRDSDLLLSHRGFLSVGHDEYWSWEMRTNVERARDSGVGLGFFCANSCYWQIRFEPSPETGADDRTIVGYKETAMAEDPFATDSDASNDHLITGLWRENSVLEPENALLGVMFDLDLYGTDDDVVIQDASHWVCAGTNLHVGDTLPRLIGYEADRVWDNPTGATVIAHSPTAHSTSDMTVYQVGDCGIVFATGSIKFSWGLDNYNADPAVGPALRDPLLSPQAQQMTRNVLSHFIGADLAITQTASPDPVVAGSAITYTITVTNFGPEPVAPVTVADALPGTVTYLSCSATNGGVCDGLGNDRQVTFPSLAVGESASATIVAIVDCSVGDGTLISNTATVTSTWCERAPESNSANATVTAVETTPEITVALNRYVLWPPNHRLSPITATVTVTDVCDPNPTFVLTSITSNEPDNGLGDGDTANDIQGAALNTADTAFLLRSERSGRGTGRIYTIVYTASNMFGNTKTATLTVRVPLNQSVSAAAKLNSPLVTVNPAVSGLDLILYSSPQFDVSRIDGHWAQLGNQAGVLSPIRTLLQDLDGDRLADLELFYDASAMAELKSQSCGEPIGFHYEVGGADCFIDDVALLAPQRPVKELAGVPESGDDGAAPGDTANGGSTQDPETMNATASVWSWSLPTPGFTTVEVFDVQGRRVRTLYSGNLSSGFHEIAWDFQDDGGGRVARGVYFYRFKAPGVSGVRKIQVTR